MCLADMHSEESKHTEPEIMVCTWLGELCYCSCLPVLPGPAWVLLSHVLHTFISGSVQYVPTNLELSYGHPLSNMYSVCFGIAELVKVAYVPRENMRAALFFFYVVVVFISTIPFPRFIFFLIPNNMSTGKRQAGNRKRRRREGFGSVRGG